jgi:hypothetical protein
LAGLKEATGQKQKEVQALGRLEKPVAVSLGRVRAVRYGTFRAETEIYDLLHPGEGDRRLYERRRRKMKLAQTISMPTRPQAKGWAYCPICTHVVETPVVAAGRRTLVKPGQKCPRCSSSLEAASVVRYEAAA